MCTWVTSVRIHVLWWHLRPPWKNAFLFFLVLPLFLSQANTYVENSLKITQMCVPTKNSFVKFMRSRTVFTFLKDKKYVLHQYNLIRYLHTINIKCIASGCTQDSDLLYNFCLLLVGSTRGGSFILLSTVADLICFRDGQHHINFTRNLDSWIKLQEKLQTHTVNANQHLLSLKPTFQKIRMWRGLRMWWWGAIWTIS